MTRAIGVAILAWAWVGLGPVDAAAQAGDTFTVRLSVVPVDARTRGALPLSRTTSYDKKRER